MSNRLLIPLSFLLAWTADPAVRAAPGQAGQAQTSEIIWTAAGFQDLDRNRDREISLNEWVYDIPTFRRLDRNGDRLLTQAEFLSADWRDERNEVFDNLDLNDDGVIEVREWPWWRASFDERDTNNNGVLSRREFDVAGGAITSGFGPPMIATINVRADQRWTDSGVDARVGDRMMFDAVGTIQLSDLLNDVVTLTGSRALLPGPRAPFPAQPAGGLIVRIGNDELVFLGDRRRLRMPTSGRLYLGINESDLADNSGAFRVTITRLTGMDP